MVLGPRLEDVKNQLSIATIMMESPVGTANKLSFIIIDNAVEYMLKVFVDKNKLAAKGKRVGKKQIPAADWADIKSNFWELIWFVESKSKLNKTMAQSIFDYHDEIRNELYHEAKPQTAYHDDIKKYLRLAKDLLTILFSITLDEQAWKQHAEYVRQRIFGKKVKLPVISERRQVKVDISKPIVTFKTEAKLSTPEIILIVVYGYVSNHQMPTANQIIDSFKFSHRDTPKKTITNRLNELVSKNRLGKENEHYLMKPDGHEILKEKFDITIQ